MYISKVECDKHWHR